MLYNKIMKKNILALFCLIFCGIVVYGLVWGQTFLPEDDYLVSQPAPRSGFQTGGFLDRLGLVSPKLTSFLTMKKVCRSDDPNCGTEDGNSCKWPKLGINQCPCGPIGRPDRFCRIFKRISGLKYDLVVSGTYLPFTINARLYDRAENLCKCLSADSLIAARWGQINVKNLKPRMLVWTINKQGKKVLEPIVKLSSVAVKNHQVVHLVLEDGRIADVSASHPTADGRLVGDLKVGNNYDSSVVKFAQLIDYRYDKTYDLLPAGDTGYYWANGVLMGSTLK